MKFLWRKKLQRWRLYGKLKPAGLHRPEKNTKTMGEDWDTSTEKPAKKQDFSHKLPAKKHFPSQIS
jgi:hypothetical protein